MRSRSFDLNWVFIFDLDDTLYKEIDFVHSAFVHIDRLLVADYGCTAGEGLCTMVAAVAKGENPFDALDAKLHEAGIHINNAIDWMVSEYRYHIPQLRLSDDVRRFLSWLTKCAFDMFIITDGRSVTQRNKIRALGLDEYIPLENVLISEEVGVDKIAGVAFSKIYDLYCDLVEDNDVQFMFIGDNPRKDFVVGNSFGYPTVMLMDDGRNIHSQDLRVPRMFKPKIKVRSFSELLSFMHSSEFSKFIK